jgi:Ni/Co efflux regulator RcnB
MKPSRLIYALAATAVFALPTAAFAQSYDGGQNWQQHNEQQNGDGSSYQRGGQTRDDNASGDRSKRDRGNRWDRDDRRNDDRNYAPPQRERFDRGNDYNGGYYGNGYGFDSSGLRVIIRL